MKFKDLKIGETFVFASENDPRFRTSGLERGPWIKSSARCYRKETDPFQGDSWRCDESELDHAFWSTHKNQVGSINVSVEAQDASK